MPRKRHASSCRLPSSTVGGRSPCKEIFNLRSTERLTSSMLGTFVSAYFATTISGTRIPAPRARGGACDIQRVECTDRWAAARRCARAIVALALAMISSASISSPLAAQPVAAAAETLHVYGPGGPLPAMRDAAIAFERRHGVHVLVRGGPTPQWLAEARTNADVIFSGAEHMMTDFQRQFSDSAVGAIASSRIDSTTITPLYLRPSAILVRKGNPQRIRGFEDLLRPGIRLLVVQGAGQTGLWEDMAGRTGDIAVVRAFRRNIRAVAPTSGEARTLWSDDRRFDAWIIWNVWQVANSEVADLVPVAPQWRVYRDAGIALTVRGTARPHAREFVTFLQSSDGARIFARWGWITKGAGIRTSRH